MPIRIMLADEQMLFRDIVRAILERDERYEIVAEVSNGPAALEVIRDTEPDLVLLDATLPEVSGAEVVRRVRQQTRTPPAFLFVSTHSSRETVEDAHRAGAAGFVNKHGSLGELIGAIESITEGCSGSDADGEALDSEATLTGREREILALIAEGMSSKEIASKLELSARTVESHRANVMAKLGIRKVAGLVRYAIRAGLLKP